MAHFLIQAVYKPEALIALAKNPQNRVEVVRQVVEKLGGKLESGGIAFGELGLEMVAICAMPDHVSAAALSIAVSVGGAVKSIKTTPLITGAEVLEAMNKAAKAGYRPPGL
jgi:uncharacterized protein with GYD domain